MDGLKNARQHANTMNTFPFFLSRAYKHFIQTTFKVKRTRQQKNNTETLLFTFQCRKGGMSNPVHRFFPALLLFVLFFVAVAHCAPFLQTQDLKYAGFFFSSDSCFQVVER